MLTNQGNSDSLSVHDTLVFLRKVVIMSIIALAWYGLSYINIYMFAVINVAIPALTWFLDAILVYGWQKNVIFKDETRANILLVVKYWTFVLQNAIALVLYWQGDNGDMSALATTMTRLNILMLLVDSFWNKWYFCWIPCLYAMIGIVGFYSVTVDSFDAFFKLFQVHITNNGLLMWDNVCSEWVVLYTIMFIQWIVYRSEYLIQVLHCLLPLLFPLRFWFSVRTITGMCLLYISCFRKADTVLLQTTLHYTAEERRGFLELFNVLVTFGCIGLLANSLVLVVENK